MHYRLLAFLLFVSTPAIAQEKPVEQPAAATEPEEGEEKGEKAERGSSLGIGPGLVFWSPPPGEADWDTSVGVALQTRKVWLLGGIFGFEFTNDVVFHDWAAMGAAYDWFFSATSEDGGLNALKWSLLWPGLFLIPFGGANYGSGVGIIVYTSPRVPAAFFDIGAQANLYLRLSDPDFRADFAIGAYGGLGYDFAEKFGTSLRVMWGSPLVHSVMDGKPRTVVTTLLNLKFSL